MPYDPALPADHSPLVAAEMRGQLIGLFEAFLAGRITSVVIDAVNTINAGDPASVSAQITGNVLHLTFNIPRGATGIAGTNGGPGGPGPAGPQGPPFANALIGGVTTLNPGDNATVTVTFDGTNVQFFFGLPAASTANPASRYSSSTPPSPARAATPTTSPCSTRPPTPPTTRARCRQS